MNVTSLRMKLFFLGIKQTDIAKKAGVDPSYVNRIINGKSKPSEKVIKAVCKLTGLPESAFIEDQTKGD